MAWGMIAGAATSAGSSYVKMNAEKKAKRREEENAEFGGARPKRRQLKRFSNAVGQAMNNRQRALIAMAQAHSNFANTI